MLQVSCSIIFLGQNIIRFLNSLSISQNFTSDIFPGSNITRDQILANSDENSLPEIYNSKCIIQESNKTKENKNPQKMNVLYFISLLYVHCHP